MDWNVWRRRWLTEPLYRRVRNSVTPFGLFQHRVLASGDSWWESHLLGGKPDWSALTYVRPVAFTQQEQAFLAGPIAELCRRIEENGGADKSSDEEFWRFLGVHRFEGMAVATEYGGWGLSPWAISEALHRVSLRSISTAYFLSARFVFGPAALLKAAGSEEQVRHWLPLLGAGSAGGAIASFAVENDIVPIQATGVVLQEGDNPPVLRLNWAGARHAPGPKPSLLVLPFRLHDPAGVLGTAGERGVCVALVDTASNGVIHHPAAGIATPAARRLATNDALPEVRGGVFDGHDVELPLSAMLGGARACEQGLPALLEHQSLAKGIALPALAAASVSLAAHASSALSRLQGDTTGSEMLGARSRLGRLAATAYRIEAARRFLCAGLGLGYRPILSGALVDIVVFEDVRSATGDSMHLLGGAGPTPALTEWQEGLHELFPALFGIDGLAPQGRNTAVLALGMLRTHPYLLKELEALERPDEVAACMAYDQIVWKHAGSAAAALGRACGQAWTGGRFSGIPRLLGPVAGHYRRVNRYASALALLVEVLQPGVRPLPARAEPALERMLRALAVLFTFCAVLKRWQDDGRHDADLPLVNWCAADAFHTIETLIEGILKNLEVPGLGAALKALLLPPVLRATVADDAITLACADLLLASSDTRERLVGPVWGSHGLRHLGALEKAYECVSNVRDLRVQIRQAGLKDWRDAHVRGGLTDAQAEALEAAEAAVIAALRDDA